LKRISHGDDLGVLTRFEVIGGSTVAATATSDQGDLQMVVTLGVCHAGGTQIQAGGKCRSGRDRGGILQEPTP
jgi:hypothetical protein